MDENLPFIKLFEAQTCLFLLYGSYKDGSPNNYNRVREGIAGCSAFVLKTCYEMEGPYLQYMRTQINKPFILTSPLVPEPEVHGILDAKWVNCHDEDNTVDENLPFIKLFEAQTYVFFYETFEDGSPSIYNRVMEGTASCSAFVLKTCQEMEGPYLHYLKTQLNKPFILAGPLVPEPEGHGLLDAKWANWLGQFPAKSVIFCSFGSETFLTREQIRELVLGLELTGLPFVIVLNFPKSVDSKAELECALPSGFLERTKDRGFVHVGWVKQQLILKHVNVGCYLCHGGFSSLIEGLVNDCQMVLLPQRADQFLNSRLVGEKGVMRAGVEVNTRDEDGYFGKEDICAAVRTIMVDVDQEPGKSIRLSQRKWYNFFTEYEVQEKFISDMVVEMKRMVYNDFY